MARRKKQNEYLMFLTGQNGTTTITTGTADGDAVAINAPVADVAIGRSCVRGQTNGTGTALVTIAWYTQAARAGNVLSASHISTAGAVYSLAAGAGVQYVADGNGVFCDGDFKASPTNDVMFLNLDFDAGSATGAGTFRASCFLLV